MASHNELGKQGEEMAVAYLIEKGYKILRRNWRFSRYEIDIIAAKDEYLHIVEVKTLYATAAGHPEDSVTKKKFRFAALQSEAGKRLLKQYQLSAKEESAVLIFNEKVYQKSSAGLQILYHVGGIYAVPFVFILVPTYIRDFYYDIIARNRYKWWGKRDTCMIPTEEIKERFL